MKPKTAQKSLGLIFTLSSLAELQEKYGLNFFDKKTLDGVEMTPVVIRRLVWAGLLHGSPDLTEMEAGNRVTDLNQAVAEVETALAKAFTGK